MKVVVINERFQPVTIDARRVMVYANDGVTPLSLALEYQKDLFCVSHFKDPEFNRVLVNLGVKTTAVVLDTPPVLLDDFKLPTH